MWPYHPSLLARAVPRYTSFPTAVEFHGGDGPRHWPAHQQRLIAAATGAVSLYVHIPYCREICWYCGCNTGAAGRRERLSAYLDALHHEIALLARRLPAGLRIGRIAFGGGSPNAVAPVDFVRLVDRLVTTLPLAADAIWSVELDPRGLDAIWFMVLGRCGIRRASLGVQSFDPGEQAAIGRIQPHRDIAAAVAGLRRAGVDSLNFDLMYGLPGQTRASLEATLAATIALAPDRIALFGYAHVPDRIPRQRQIDASNLPDVAARFAMAAAGHRQLTAAGYAAVGFDHFARPADPLARAAADGTLGRNFQGFTDDPAPVLIGLGASAISQFPGAFVQNDKNAGRYRMCLSGGQFAGAMGTGRSDDDRARGQIITDILCHRPADARRYPDVLAGLWAFAERGLVEVAEGWVRPVAATRPYARAIAAHFDPYRAASTARFSTAV